MEKYNNYKSVVEDYIDRKQTSYALMIGGNWGIGKTHFVRNEVFPYLVGKGLEPIYISLNGISTVEEINKLIYFETSFLSNEKFKKIRESKAVKYGTQIFKVIHNAAAIMNVSGKGENEISYEELIDLQEKAVLCFDDLERCKIDIIEIMGYINKFVEQDGIKTIIIANEKEIKDLNTEQNKELKFIAAINSQKLDNQTLEEDEIINKATSLFIEQKRYEVIKEKVIGKTLIYEPDFSIIIDDIIKDYEDSYKDYYKYLTEVKDDILYFFNRSNDKNIRILKYTLNDYAKIFDVLNNKVETLYKKELLDTVFFPSFLYSMEYKKGAIKQKDVIKHEDVTLISTSSSILNGTNYNNKLNKYLSGYTNYKVFYSLNSINEYIINSNYNEIKIIDEINEVVSILSRKYNKQPKSSLELIIDYYWELENNDFERHVQQVIENVKNATYPVEYYSRVFFQLNEFAKLSLIDINSSDLLEITKESIKKAVPLNNSEDRFHRFMIQNKTDEHNQIEKLITARLNESKDIELRSRIDSLIDSMTLNTDAFIKEFASLGKVTPIMKYINIEDFAKKIVELNNEGIIDIARMFDELGEYVSVSDNQKENLEHINHLIQLLEELNKSKQSITKLNLSHLIGTLKDFAENLKKQ